MIYIYLIIILNLYSIVLLHEYGHLISALILGYKIKKIKIGNDLFSFNFGKFELSPIIVKGEVSVFFNNKNKKNNLFIFFFSGIYYQLIYQGFILLFYQNITIILISSAINLFYLLSSLIPIFNSDLNSYIKKIKSL